MNALSSFTWRVATVLRWAARIAGGLLFLFIAAFVIAEGPPAPWRMTGREQLFGLGLLALFGGLAAAWKWPLGGGLTTLAGWALFSAVSGKPMTGGLFLTPAVVGLVNIFCWARLRGAPPPPFRWTRTAVALAALTGVFILLSANEMFGQPPLTTPKLDAAPFAGEWVADIPAEFNIAADGKVTGSIAGVPILEAEIIGNRSWFGRLLNWRTDYIIRGRLTRLAETPAGPSGDRFTAPINAAGADLRGTLFLAHPGRELPSRLLLRRR
jgi:hypothetical protein